MMNHRDRLLSVMEQVIGFGLDRASCAADVHLFDLGFGSLALVTLVIALQEEFDLQLDDMCSIQRSCTVGSLLSLCSNRRKQVA